MAAQAHEPAGSLRVLTTNLFNRRGLAAGLQRVIDALEPDVVLAQELVPAHAEVLERVFPYGKLMPRTDTRGMGIAGRFPMEVEPLPMPRRYFLKGRLTTADGQAQLPIELINVHLSCPDRVEALDERREQLLRLCDYMRAQPGVRRVLAGDFNTTPGMPAYRALRRTMCDAVVQATQAAGTRPQPTWGPTPTSRRLCRIDHIFVQGFSAQAAQVVDVAGSDHDAVCVQLRMGPAAGHG